MNYLRPRARFFALLCLAQVPLAWFFDDVWFMDATLHFLPQQIALFVISLTIWLAPTRKLSSIAVSTAKACGLSLVFAIMLMLSGRIPFLSLLFVDQSTGLPTRAPDFQLITFNVLTSNTLKEDAVNWIGKSLSKTTPNVVVLLEPNRDWVAEAERLKDRLSFVYAEPRSDNFGMAVFSSVPLIDGGFTKSETQCILPTFSGRIAIGNRTAKILAVHAVPPAPDTLAIRDHCLKEMETATLNSVDGAILTGDFNCSPWAKCFPRGLRDPAPFLFRSHTWSMLGGVVSTSLDHVLHTGLIIASVPEVGPDLGSDHRPLITKVWLGP